MNRNPPAATPGSSRLPWILLAAVVAVIAAVTLYRQYGAVDAGDKPAAAGTAQRGTVPGQPTPEEIRALARRSTGASGAATARDMAGVLEKRKRMAEATQAANRERNAAMASRFAAEKSDPAWSGMHEKDLAVLLDSDPIRDASAKPENFRAECRSTMCRIQADFPNRSMASDWLQLYMGSVGDRLPMATAHQVTNPDGSVRVEIYGVGRKH